MATMSSSDYRREVRMFRGEFSDPPAVVGGRRTLRGAGFQWYKVKAEPGLSLYIDTSNLYLKAVRNGVGCYKFYQLPDPQTRTGAIINATQLEFLESYNSNGERPGIGLPQDQACTVTVENLNQALSTLASDAFGGKKVDEQRLAVARCVVALIEAARFKDVEDQVVDGTPITDRRWTHHGNQSKVVIAP